MYGCAFIFVHDVPLTNFQLQPDSEVAGLLKQLNGHLQSMHNNVAPLDGLKEAITRSQAALNLLPIPAD